jgi:hypothetical protein
MIFRRQKCIFFIFLYFYFLFSFLFSFHLKNIQFYYMCFMYFIFINQHSEHSAIRISPNLRDCERLWENPSYFPLLHPLLPLLFHSPSLDTSFFLLCLKVSWGFCFLVLLSLSLSFFLVHGCLTLETSHHPSLFSVSPSFFLTRLVSSFSFFTASSFSPF